MAHNYIACDREQQFLMPPSLNEWLPENHLARFVVAIVERLDLSRFYRVHRNDGAGRPAYDPKMMVALLIYAYATGCRSSRQIERRCLEDVAFRFITANECPDHATIARFRAGNDRALAQLFVQVLELCAEAGLVRVGVVALDGHRVKANASYGANRTRKAIEEEVRAILDEVADNDATDDRNHGSLRGDELPEVDPNSRLGRLLSCKQRLDEQEAARHADYEAKLERIEQHRLETGKPPPGRPPTPPENKVGGRRSERANTTDPDSRVMMTVTGVLQGYNAQAVATSDQIVIAASVASGMGDQPLFAPMLEEAEVNLIDAGVSEKIGVVLADAGYYSDDNATQGADGPERLIATAKSHKLAKVAPRGRIPHGLRPRQLMERKLATRRGQRLYKKRSQTVEPVFGQHRMRGLERFSRRGAEPCSHEWKFENSVHNLLKLRRSGRFEPPSPGTSPRGRPRNRLRRTAGPHPAATRPFRCC